MEQMDFDEDFFAKQLASARRGQIHSELYTGYRKGIIPKPKISWHETIEDIDFSLQTDRLNNKLHSGDLPLSMM